MGPEYPEIPAVYTRVTSYLGWLDQILGTSSNLPPTNKWPWHAFIYGDGLFVSSGSLIHPQWILTSARGVSKYKMSFSLKDRSNVYIINQEFHFHRSFGLSLSFAKWCITSSDYSKPKIHPSQLQPNPPYKQHCSPETTKCHRSWK